MHRTGLLVDPSRVNDTALDHPSRAGRTRLIRTAGIVLLAGSVVLCGLLGTVGWFGVGFGMMTDCTDDYSCTQTGCPPCGTAETWINVGGLLQWGLAAAAVVALACSTRIRRPWVLLAAGPLVSALSVAAIVGTTWQAQESYCQPGT